MLNKMWYQTDDQHEMPKQKKERILNEIKDDLMEEFTHQINLEDLDKHINQPSKEFFAIYNELHQKNKDTRSVLSRKRKQLNSSINSSNDNSRFLSVQALHRTLSDFGSYISETPEFSENLAILCKQRQEEIDEQVQSQWKLERTSRETFKFIQKLKKESFEMNKLLEVYDKKFSNVARAEILAQQKFENSIHTVNNFQKQFEDLDDQKVIYRFQKSKIIQNIRKQNQQSQNDFAVLRLKINVTYKTFFQYSIKEQQLLQLEQQNEIQKLQNQEEAILTKMIDSKNLTQIINTIIKLEEIFLIKNQDHANLVELLKKELESKELSIHQDVENVQDSYKALDRKQIIRKTAQFYQLHPDGPIMLVERIIKYYKSMQIILQSYEKQYEELLDEKKQKQKILQSSEDTLKQIISNQEVLQKLQMKGQGIYDGYEIPNDIESQNVSIQQSEAITQILTDLNTKVDSIQFESIHFKEEFDIKQRIMMKFYSSCFGMISKYYKLIENKRFYKLISQIIRDSCDITDYDPVVEMLYLNTKELYKKLKYGMKQKKNINLKNQPNQVNITSSIFKQDKDNQFLQYLDSAQYIPFDINELIVKFLQKFPNEKTRSEDWAMWIKQVLNIKYLEKKKKNIIVGLLLSGQEIDNYLDKIIEDNKLDDNQIQAQKSIEGVGVLLINALKEFDTISQKLTEQLQKIVLVYKEKCKKKGKVQHKFIDELQSDVFRKYHQRAIQNIYNYKNENFEIINPVTEKKYQQSKEQGEETQNDFYSIKEIINIHSQKVDKVIDHQLKQKAISHQTFRLKNIVTKEKNLSTDDHLDKIRETIKSSQGVALSPIDDQHLKKIQTIAIQQPPQQNKESDFSLRKILITHKTFQQIKKIETQSSIFDMKMYLHDELKSLIPQTLKDYMSQQRSILKTHKPVTEGVDLRRQTTQEAISRQKKLAENCQTRQKSLKKSLKLPGQFSEKIIMRSSQKLLNQEDDKDFQPKIQYSLSKTMHKFMDIYKQMPHSIQGEKYMDIRTHSTVTPFKSENDSQRLSSKPSKNLKFQL